MKHTECATTACHVQILTGRYCGYCLENADRLSFICTSEDEVRPVANAVSEGVREGAPFERIHWDCPICGKANFDTFICNSVFCKDKIKPQERPKVALGVEEYVKAVEAMPSYPQARPEVDVDDFIIPEGSPIQDDPNPTKTWNGITLEEYPRNELEDIIAELGIENNKLRDEIGHEVIEIKHNGEIKAQTVTIIKAMECKCRQAWPVNVEGSINYRCNRCTELSRLEETDNAN